jgi:ubiquinone/menaquinone biosynthesis C-methylase UbiE
MNPSYAKNLIEKTKEDFDKIAESFSESRKELWPEFEELKKYIKDGKKILDLGCGNGRLFQLFKDKNIEYLGVDSSEKLIEKAREKYGDYFKVADILELPFSDNHFDSIWTIAVFHHIPSEQLRFKALKEIKRVLKKNGKVIMICWNLWQPNYLKVLLKFTLIKLFKGSKLDFKDIFVPWKKTKVQRYYHAFTKRELKGLFQKAGFQVEELRYLKRNEKKTNILAVGIKQ